MCRAGGRAGGRAGERVAGSGARTNGLASRSRAPPRAVRRARRAACPLHARTTLSRPRECALSPSRRSRECARVALRYANGAGRARRRRPVAQRANRGRCCRSRGRHRVHARASLRRARAAAQRVFAARACGGAMCLCGARAQQRNSSLRRARCGATCARAPTRSQRPSFQVYLPTYSPMAAASRARAAEAEDAAFAASRGEAPPAGATRGGSTWKAVAARRDGLK